MGPASPFAASELVYFHPKAFAREKSLVDAVTLVHTEQKYDGSELGGALLLAALLDLERRGVVQLEAQKASRLFGLRKVDAIFVKPGSRPDDSPPHSLEARVRPFVDGRPKPPEAKDVLVHVLQEDASDPYAWAVRLVERGLSERGLLEVRETRRLKVFRSQAFALPERTAALARDAGADEVRETLERARTQRPEDWRLLQSALKDAISHRTERDTSDFPD